MNPILFYTTAIEAVSASWLVCWFFLFWYFSTPSRVRGHKQSIGFGVLTYLVFALIFSLYYVLYNETQRIITMPLSTEDYLLAFLGIILLVGGQVSMVVSRRTLSHFSNSDMLFASIKTKSKKDRDQYAGHSMYLSLVLALLGSVLIFRNEWGLPIVACIAAILLTRAYLESK